MRKLKELREQEEADRRESEERARREEEADNLRRLEAARFVRAELERQAREEAERLERAKKEHAEGNKRELEELEARRQRIYEEASAEEQQRCRQRDFARWNLHKFTLWTKKRSVERFVAVSTEFDKTQFCETQPLTFESIPWPVLHSPLHLKLEDIEWHAVEEFFRMARMVIGEVEYKTMIVKAHRGFHPDKWRSRGILKTVLDEEMRKQWEEAGNVVAQAITPLWLASKAR
ncbi:uncharacterized protein PHACADRAFT_265530 [Phanerochaete carnosa HHB-10118-sp]|uniref:Uncharacterized protein n=1 Tax=Phanerochaete carnosa (strain HHB-10118-sp) TaxID=650164 RepID=K5VTF4_PHACS|nr:uncharacterized protein PHACADRAFT_265530 [Phanerochaete carnosa HHB-10118-sp]EKM49824.1 hypothetical protein PHACADRAFT_265530 [Phanerochaete carnosa HHB-10118-sp]